MVQKGCVRVDQQPGDIPNGHAVPFNKRNLPAQMIVKPNDPRRQTLQVQQQGTQQQRVQVQPEQSQKWQQLFPQDICQEQDIIKYVHVLARLVQEAQTHEEKLLYIEALPQLGVPQVLAILEPIVAGKITHPGYPVDDVTKVHEEINYIRTAAIISLQELVQFHPQQVQALLLPIYRNAYEPYQVRLAAISIVLQTKPQIQVLDSIVSQLHRETNQQVRSFVVTALQKQANLTIPCLKPLAQTAQQVVDFLPEVNQGMEYSTSKTYDFFCEHKQFGLFAKKQWIASNISAIPRFGEFTLGTSDGPFVDQLLRIAYHSKGFEKLVKRILEPQGVLSQLFETLSGERKQQQQTHQSRPRRSVSSIEQALEILKQKLNFVVVIGEFVVVAFVLQTKFRKVATKLLVVPRFVSRVFRSPLSGKRFSTIDRRMDHQRFRG
eukprot:TRINITY_DN11656_c0_g3_i1.p1 TRINITY_DN11656_c0_g3~~TRINITY_DN11656_c0_g3_i1.p1  ORF type:complete len:499 (-),score=87.20 TRINITY_DN11656_c0_g3_i1:1079-2383(-)